MDIPQQFRYIARRMHQDIDRILPAESGKDEFIEYLVRGLPSSQREIAARFIDKLLSSNLTTHELVALWTKAGADWYMTESNVVPFLEQLRDALR